MDKLAENMVDLGTPESSAEDSSDDVQSDRQVLTLSDTKVSNLGTENVHMVLLPLAKKEWDLQGGERDHGTESRSKAHETAKSKTNEVGTERVASVIKKLAERGGRARAASLLAIHGIKCLLFSQSYPRESCRATKREYP